MKAHQLEALIRHAERGQKYASELKTDHMKIVQDMLMGWHECALSLGDNDLAHCAYRAHEWIDAAFQARLRSKFVITEIGRKLMWGDES